jgi:NADH:ubiquinone oxidoreductase subunit E
MVCANRDEVVKGCRLFLFIRKVGMGKSDTKTLSEFVADVVEKNSAERSRLSAILHEIQREYNYLPEQALRDIATLMEIPITDIYGVATFYTSFSLVPKGLHIVTVCMGTACHVRNSRGILDEICRFLEIRPGESTEDMAFSLETVNCLGACAMGPIMVVDGKYYGEMTATKVGRILKKYQREEAAAPTVAKRFASGAELESHRESVKQTRYSDAASVYVCSGTGCQASSGLDVLEAMRLELKSHGLDDKVLLRGTGCHGFCERGPLVVVGPENILYQKVTPEDVGEVVAETVKNGRAVERLLYEDPASGRKFEHKEEVPFYAKQKRLILGPNGVLDPAEIDDYIACGGYAALAKALFEMDPEGIIDEVGGGAAEASRPRTSGSLAARRAASTASSTCSATRTKVTPGLSWTAASSRGTRTVSSRG